MYNYQLTLFLELVGKFDKKLNFQWLAKIRPYKNQVGPAYGRKCDYQESGVYYKVFMYNYHQLTLFLVLIWKFDQKSSFHPQLAWSRPYKSQIGPKRRENMIFHSWEWCYIVSIYKYYQLNLFLLLIRKFD